MSAQRGHRPDRRPSHTLPASRYALSLQKGRLGVLVAVAAGLAEGDAPG